MGKLSKSLACFLLITSALIVCTCVSIASTFPFASAIQFSFDTNSGYNSFQPNYSVPAIVVGLVALAGIFITVGERKKAKGMWFSDKEKLR